MNARLAILGLLLALAAAESRAEDLARLGLDDPSAASPTIQADTRVKTEGASSLRIATLWPTTVTLGEVAGPDIEAATLVYSAKVKTDLQGSGNAYLELWAHLDGGQYFSRGLNDVLSGRSDWRTLRTPFIFQKGQTPEKVTLNLVINGTGTVWIDDVVLSREGMR